MQFHILSFEGPDPYARAGGLGSRIEGLARTLSSRGFTAHLWFVGDPDRPGHEVDGNLHLHRWCQWISAHHKGGVYDGEEGKVHDYASSLPPHLARELLLPHVGGASGAAVVLAEEWHTVDAVLHLDRILRDAGVRERVSILWNANNDFGFDRIPWAALARSALITTVSRYMKHRMQRFGVDPLVVANGLPIDAFDPPDHACVRRLRRRFRDRTIVTKMARFDPDKQWLLAVDTVAEMKLHGWRPLLIARGGSEAHGAEVLDRARQRRLVVRDVAALLPGPAGLLDAVSSAGDADVVNLRSHVDSAARRTLFRGADAVLANSSHEPFGLVGLETMAVGGVACTGCSGEDYVVPGQNALVLETRDPQEFLGLFHGLHSRPERVRELRRHARATARRYAWAKVVENVLLPRIELARSG